MRQKEKNIKAELAGGVMKQYQPVGLSIMHKSLRQKATIQTNESIDHAGSPSPSSGDKNIVVNFAFGSQDKSKVDAKDSSE